jgi:hypothetical protein
MPSIIDSVQQEPKGMKPSAEIPLPMRTKARTDMAELSVKKSATEALLPRRAEPDRSDNELLTVRKFRMEVADASRTLLLSDTDDPMDVKFNTLTLPATRAFWTRDSAEPRRAQLRKLILDASANA